MNSIFLLIISIYALFIGYKFIKSNVKKSFFTSFIIILITSTLLFFLIDIVTFEPQPNKAVSGNGNLGLIVLYFLIPIFLILLFILSKGIYQGFKQQPLSELKKYIIFGFFLIVLGTILQIKYVSNTLDALLNHPYNPFEEGFRGNIINQYTNTLFFNGYIYGILIGAVVIGTLLTLWFKRGKDYTKI